MLPVPSAFVRRSDQSGGPTRAEPTHVAHIPDNSAIGAGIARAGMVLLLGTVASRLLGLLRDVVVSARFGTSGDLDLYVAAFRVPDLAFTLVSGGALGSALVPVFSQALHRADNNERLGRTRLVMLAGATSAAVLIVATTLAAVAALYADSLAPLLGAGWTADAQSRLAALVRILLIQPVLLGTGEVLARFLNVNGRFGATAFAPAAYTAGIVFAAVLAPVELGTVALAWGVVGGAVLFLLILVIDAWRTGFRPPTSFRHVSGTTTDLVEIVSLMIPRVVGQGAVQLSFVATTRLASYLPTGRLASLNYAWALMMLPLGAFAMTAANAAFPTFAALAATGDLATLASTGRRTVGTVAASMIVALAGAIALGADAIEVLFGRLAFDGESVRLTAGALTAYAVGLPAHGVLEVQMRLAFALKDTRTPVLIGVLAMAANVLIATVLSPLIGHVGIGLALSIAATAEAIALGIVVERQLPGVHGQGLAVLALRLAAIATGAALAGSAVSAVLSGVGASALTRLALSGVAFAGTVGFGAWGLGVSELTQVATMVLRRAYSRRNHA